MFTRCPECRSQFQVSAEDLRDAQGYVRCGECHAIFSALESLSDQSFAADDVHELKEPVLAPPTLAPFSATDAESDADGFTTAAEAPLETLDVEQEPVELSPPDDAPPEVADVDESADDAPDEVEITELEAEIPSAPAPYQPPPPGTAPNRGETFGSLSTTTDDTGEMSLDEIISIRGKPIEQVIWSDEDDPAVEPVAAPIEATLQIALPLDDNGATPLPVPAVATTTEPAAHVDEDSDDDWVEFSYTETGSEDEETFVIDDPVEIDNDTTDDELTVTEASATHAMTQDYTAPWWLAAVLVLAALLAGQIALGTESGIEFRCRVMGCTTLIRQDLERIVALSTNIQRHPGIDGALVVSATLRNDAPFPQPYPVVEVKLTDIKGDIIAMRRFQSREYINDDDIVKKGISPEVLVPVVFEVVDPGIDAVTFEFDFL